MIKKYKQKDKITVYLTTDLREGLEIEKKRIGGTRSAIVREALDNHFASVKQKLYEQTIACQKLEKRLEEQNESNSTQNR